MFVKKITSKDSQVNKFTNQEESVCYITFSEVKPNNLGVDAPQALGMLSGVQAMPEDCKYGNSYIYGQDIDAVKAQFAIGADFSEWLQFGDAVIAKATGVAVPNLYKITAK